MRNKRKIRFKGPHTEETKRKISENKERVYKISIALKGRKLSQTHILNISKGHKGKIPKWLNPKQRVLNISNTLKGRIIPIQHRINMSLGSKGKNKGIIRSKETRQKISIAKRNPTDETRKKLRLATINYQIKTRGHLPKNIGKYETQILDIIEPSIGFPIIRQYEIDGYFVDGYCPQRNIVFEVDEEYHKNRLDKDIERENYIKSKLNCSFIRIPCLVT